MSLKKTDIEMFKKRLEEIRFEMTKLVKEASEEVKEKTGSSAQSQHQADGGTDDYDRALSLELTDNEIKTLRQIDRALEKIEEGTYGVCEGCGQPIPLMRLRALLTARSCVPCQLTLER